MCWGMQRSSLNQLKTNICRHLKWLGSLSSDDEVIEICIVDYPKYCTCWTINLFSHPPMHETNKSS